ncbi:uncharacterized protein B0I36DRAFT_434150 [Microdochium trichocladiopsis]|uniref:F-box domain-containing protein n=1 Tax=Microdochium trichocladiopsis TaxID=1682393 RepID=A0A9P8XXH2_9PEZI|nr:uncharacterized protein B0I36DRAFT_434150 [Microdochium trichocladiopsis]KAH7024395.1 hypothetical protein B0I36DRAFT_434150 [Microdochium trichocladiopsis]
MNTVPYTTLRQLEEWSSSLGTAVDNLRQLDALQVLPGNLRDAACIPSVAQTCSQWTTHWDKPIDSTMALAHHQGRHFHVANAFLCRFVTDRARGSRGARATPIAASLKVGFLREGRPLAIPLWPTSFAGRLHGEILQSLTRAEVLVEHFRPEHLDALASALAHARDLQELTVGWCKYKRRGSSTPTTAATTFLADLARRGISWPRLEGLHIRQVGLPVEVLASLVALHSSMLRRMLLGCHITVGHIMALANIPGLCLQDFSIPWGGHPSRIWRFEWPRHQVVRYGVDPHTFTYGWSEAFGDTAEPTPFGPEFADFVEKQTELLGDAYDGNELVIPDDATCMGASEAEAASNAKRAWDDSKAGHVLLDLLTVRPVCHDAQGVVYSVAHLDSGLEVSFVGLALVFLAADVATRHCEEWLPLWLPSPRSSHLSSPPVTHFLLTTMLDDGRVPARLAASLATLAPELLDVVVRDLPVDDLKTLRLVVSDEFHDAVIGRYFFSPGRAVPAGVPSARSDLHCEHASPGMPRPDPRMAGLSYMRQGPWNCAFKGRFQGVVWKYHRTCWLSPCNTLTGLIAVLNASRPWLDDALARLPGLDTIDVQPPPLDRAIRSSKYINQSAEPLHPPGRIFASPACLAREFLCQAFEESRQQSPTAATSPVAIHVRDYRPDGIDDVDQGTGQSLYGTPRAECLRSLTVVRLALDQLMINHLPTVISALAEATGLKKLDVRPRSRDGYKFYCDPTFGVPPPASLLSVPFLEHFLARQELVWPQLESLVLAAIQVRVDAFRHFVTLHAGTLRELYMSSSRPSPATVAHIQALATVPGLRLERFEVKTPEPALTVKERAMLNYLENPRCASNVIGIRLSKIKQTDRVAVSVQKPANSGWRTMDWWKDTEEILLEVRPHLTSYRFSTAKRYERTWRWVRPLPGDMVWYWPVGDDEEPGEPTGEWTFRRAGDSESSAQTGDDPHSIWHDWDEAKGDVAEPRPFSHELSVFMVHRASCTGDVLKEGEMALLPSDARMFDWEDMQHIMGQDWVRGP